MHKLRGPEGSRCDLSLSNKCMIINRIASLIVCQHILQVETGESGHEQGTRREGRRGVTKSRKLEE